MSVTNPESYFQLEDSVSVQIDDYRLAIQTEVEYFTDNTPIFSNPFIQSAWACSPAPPEPTEIITKIEITSIGDLITFEGDTLQAGTSLTDFLRPDRSDFSLTELIQTGLYAPKEEGIIPEMLRIKAFPIDISQPHQFSVVYELNNGNIFTASSPIIFLNL
ncbi:MAG: hypothetical protein NXI23_26700 [Bacteroidetes bacterium]|nr:hypothetical protein [Bacteroidota bacterium]MDF1866374.1 hypothetical protein [Saprospiraceae bacterium]